MTRHAFTCLPLTVFFAVSFLSQHFGVQGETWL